MELGSIGPGSASTVTAQVAVFVPSATLVTVMVVVPAETAVNVPS